MSVRHPYLDFPRPKAVTEIRLEVETAAATSNQQMKKMGLALEKDGGASGIMTLCNPG